jgi:hydrogenase maturation factor
LKIHPHSKTSEIHKRTDDLDISYLRRIVYKMVDSDELSREGEKKNMVYFISK